MRATCRAFALNYSWENSARQFIGHARKVAGGTNADSRITGVIAETAHG